MGRRNGKMVCPSAYDGKERGNFFRPLWLGGSKDAVAIASRVVQFGGDDAESQKGSVVK